MYRCCRTNYLMVFTAVVFSGLILMSLVFTKSSSDKNEKRSADLTQVVFEGELDREFGLFIKENRRNRLDLSLALLPQERVQFDQSEEKVVAFSLVGTTQEVGFLRADLPALTFHSDTLRGTFIVKARFRLKGGKVRSILKAVEK